MTRQDPYGIASAGLAPLLKSLDEDERRETVVLTREENDAFESLSLKRFPVLSWGVLDWDNSPFLEQHFIDEFSELTHVLPACLRRYTQESSLMVVMWGNLALPSVSLSARTLARHVSELIATCDEYWMFAVDENILIEYHHDGRLTVARVPNAG